ncbi:MAG: alpha/beta fold hydrolase [Elusimicrobia bacterium]|nr:alpha/beta fold hydrolase [Elusimicrobiota bacterium]
MRLHLREAGDPKGPPIVLLHAFPLSSAMWEPQVEALQGLRVLMPDLRGFGGTPLAAPWFIEHAVADVLETVPETPAVFVGLSMGGYVALRLAEKAPERVRALVLCDTRAEADANEHKLKRAAAVDFLRAQGVATFVAPFLKDALAPGRPDVLEFLRGVALRSSPEAVLAALAALAARPDMTASLSKIQVPTLILVGAQDKITPPSLSEAMRSRIPGAELHLIPATGHFSNAENPAAFNERLGFFLKRL